MGYHVEVAFAPAYELVVSLLTYTTKRRPKSLALGADWVAATAKTLDPATFEPIRELDLLPALLLMVRSCPQGGDTAGFLSWFAALSPDEFHERLSSCTALGKQAPVDARSAHPLLVQALCAWNEHYFRHLDPALLAGLAADAQTVRGVAAITPPAELVELATGGIDLAPAPGLDTVVLIPQHHFRPINLYLHLPDCTLVAYPADVLPPEPGEPPLALTRLTGALADSSRLKILRMLASRSLSFTEIQKEMGLAKSTVHHHLVTLRAAGLIRVHDLREEGAKYSLRPAALDMLGARLGAYLKEQEA